MESDRLQEWIEASRPSQGGDDDCGLAAAEALALHQAAEDPAIAARLARVHGWDAAICGEMEEIPIPDGLADRINAAVQRELTPQPAVTKAAPLPSPSRRRWLTIAMGSAAALLIAVSGWYWGQRPTELTAERLQQLAAEMRDVADAQEVAWQDDVSAAPLATHPVDTSLVAQPWRWRRQATSLDRQAVVYDLSHTRRNMRLVVMQANVASDLTSRAPTTPQSTTGGVCVGLWQRDGLVYALVVEGNEPWYRSVLKNSLPTA
jgi:hypothetical protein